MTLRPPLTDAQITEMTEVSGRLFWRAVGCLYLSALSFEAGFGFNAFLIGGRPLAIAITAVSFLASVYVGISLVRRG